MTDSRTMKYFRALTIAAVFLMLFSTACSEDDKLTQNSTNVGILPIEDTDVDPLGDTFYVAYTSPGDWTATLKSGSNGGGTNWLSLKKKSGSAGTSMVGIEVKPNITGESRSVKVVFSGSESFEIFQASAYIDTPDEIECGWLGDEKSLDVKSNINWVISVTHGDNSNKSWLNIPTGDFENDKKLSVQFTGNNFSGNKTDAVISIVPVKLDNKGNKVNLDNDVKNNLSREIKVSQSNIIFQVNGDVDDPGLANFSEFGERKDGEGNPYVEDPYQDTLEIVSETVWKIADRPDWMECRIISESGKGVITSELELTVREVNNNDDNTDAEGREGVVKLVSIDDERAFREIRVRQNAYKWNVGLKDGNGNDFSTMPVDPSGTAELVITTNGPWSIDRYTQEWLKIDENNLSGVGDARIPVTSEVWNLEQSEVLGNIYLVTGINALTADLNVAKDPFVFKVGENKIADEDNKKVAEILKKLPMKNTKEYDLHVDSSGPWEMTFIYPDGAEGDKKDWFLVSSQEGDSGSTLTVNASGANPDNNSDRTVTLLFVSKLHRDNGQDLSLPISVTQEKYMFEIEQMLFENVPAYKKSGIQYQTLLSCSYDWTATWDEGISVTSDKSGDVELNQGDGLTYPNMYLNVDTNTEKESKTKKVTIHSHFGGGESKIIEIHQDAFIFDVDTRNLPYGQLAFSNDETYIVPVQSTEEAEWEVTVQSETDWIRPTVSSATTSKDIEFTVTKNGTLSERSADVTIYNNVSKESKSFSFTQEAYNYKVSGTDSFNTFDEFAANNIVDQTFTVESKGPWRVKESTIPSWISIVPDHGDGGNIPVVVRVNVVEDNLASERSFTFTVDGSYGGVDWITPKKVIQREYVFEVTGDMTLNDYNMKTIPLSIKSSGSWEAASSDMSIVTLSAYNGSASRDYPTTNYVSVTANYSSEPKNATVTVRSQHYKDDATTPDLKKVIYIQQPAYEFEVGGKTVSYDYASIIPAAGVTSQSVNIKCSGTWTVTSSEAWLTITRESNGFSFNVASNMPTGTNETIERSATITVKTIDQSSRTINITVRQSGAKAQVSN